MNYYFDNQLLLHSFRRHCFGGGQGGAAVTDYILSVAKIQLTRLVTARRRRRQEVTLTSLGSKYDQVWMQIQTKCYMLRGGLVEATDARLSSEEAARNQCFHEAVGSSGDVKSGGR